MKHWLKWLNANLVLMVLPAFLTRTIDLTIEPLAKELRLIIFNSNIFKCQENSRISEILNTSSVSNLDTCSFSFLLHQSVVILCRSNLVCFIDHFRPGLIPIWSHFQVESFERKHLDKIAHVSRVRTTVCSITLKH